MSYKIEQGNEEINSIGGICLVGRILGEVKLFKSIDKMTMPKTKKGVISHGDILKSMVGQYSLGKSDYADIELYRDDLFLEAEEDFLIKHNLRKESLEQWLANARRMGECNSPRPGKNVFTGILNHLRPEKCKSDKPLFAVF